MCMMTIATDTGSAYWFGSQPSLSQPDNTEVVEPEYEEVFALTDEVGMKTFPNLAYGQTHTKF